MISIPRRARILAYVLTFLFAVLLQLPPAPTMAATSLSTVFTNAPGFDACTPPTTTAMKAWWGTSPYQWVGVYVGGINRSCKTGPTNSWVATVASYGWDFLPIYVGEQAPASCVSAAAGFASMSSNPVQASLVGLSDALDAVQSAQGVNFPQGSIIYNDMEYYTTDVNGTCDNAVLSYLNNWTEELHTLGFRSGVYIAGNNAASLSRATIIQPDDVWVAGGGYVAPTISFNSACTPYGVSNLSDNYQHGHRLYQSPVTVGGTAVLGHTETWGGVTIPSIDSNCADGEVVGQASGSGGGTPVTASNNGAASPNATPLLMIHGFDDNCQAAFQQEDTNANYTQMTTEKFLAQHGWVDTGLHEARGFARGTNLDQVGYYNNSYEAGCTTDPPSMTPHTHNVLDAATSQCTQYRIHPADASQDGSLNDPIRHLSCLMAWYIYTNYTAKSIPVNVLAHSMGGLLIRDAIGETTNHVVGFPPQPLFVQRVVTVGTPHNALGGAYVAALRSLAVGDCGVCIEVADMSANSSFMQEIAPYQAPQGQGGTYWALMAASDSCPFGKGGAALSCTEGFNLFDPYPDGDGVVQATSALGMSANYKILYGVVDHFASSYPADAATQYQHERNSPTLVPPYYLNDAIPYTQSTKAWICTTNCNAIDFSDMKIADNTAIAAPHSLAEIANLISPSVHVGTSLVTYVQPSNAIFSGKLWTAWTGPDKRLNLITTGDGTHYSAPLTLSDTSDRGPSLAGIGNNLYIAWEGTDDQHHIYLQSYNGTSFVNHIALPESTFYAPAIAAYGTTLFLAWTGKDTNHSLNIESSTDGVHFGNKVTLPYSSWAGPALNSFPGRNLALAWTGTDSAHHLNITYTTDGTTFPPPTPLSATSLFAPALTHNIGAYLLAWCGMDNRLNVESSLYPDVSIDNSNHDTLGDTSGAAPAVVAFNDQLYWAWSGTDSPAHLYIAAEQ